MSTNFIETKITQQKQYTSNNNKNINVSFPTVLTPSPSLTTLSHVTNSIAKIDKHLIESLLHDAGAVLFRECHIRTGSDFNDFVEAFGLEELAYSGVANRTHVVGRVWTANESPPEEYIPFHHEMVRYPKFPSKLFFFCEVEPESGGETPVVLSHIVYEKMKEKHPELVAELEEHGFIDTRIVSHDDDLSSPIGRSWKSTFQTEDKCVAEERASKLGMKLEWSKDSVKIITGPAPAIKYDESRNRKIWFNNIAVGYTSSGEARNNPPMVLTLGNNKPLSSHLIIDFLKILQQESVSLPWKRGDVLLIDNLAVLHARNPCYSTRRVLASLCK